MICDTIRAPSWCLGGISSQPSRLATVAGGWRSRRCGNSRGSIRCSAEEEDTAPVLGDWRAFRAKLVSQQASQAAHKLSEDNVRLLELQNPSLAAEEMWAHATPGPEKGGVLVASPDVVKLLGNGKYWQVVVFLVEHNEGGSVGLILNRPSGMVMGRRPGGLPFVIAGAPGSMQNTFEENRVYCGGFTAQQIIHIMHGHRLQRAVEVVPGVMVGGEAAATEEVMAGRLSPEQFKFFSGAMVWEPGQLEREVKDGAWYTAACSRALVLKQCLQLPVPLWREMLQLMGGEYLATARAAYEGDE